ncbi:MAG TPA: dCTP deaminase [Steroidobacteraceae bacterium]|jgi:dCTP deaminase|nr:dCTP deaminase [Steroidobacteraceae bacterium]
MILSNVEIQLALDQKRLIIDPEPHPRTPGGAGIDCPYQTSAVDLRLGNEIAYFKENLPIDINLGRGGFAALFGAHSNRQFLTHEQPFSLRPGRLVLGKTLERIELPIGADGDCLAARLEGKSSYSRCGLLVHFTAPTIHSGYNGTITLELYNMGSLNISLYPGTPICQLIVEVVKGVPFRNDSQFQGQSAPGGRV